MTEFFQFALGGTAWGGFWRFAGVVVLIAIPCEVIGKVAIAVLTTRRREASSGESNGR